MAGDVLCYVRATEGVVTMLQKMRVPAVDLSRDVVEMSSFDIADYTLQYLDDQFIKDNMRCSICEDCPYSWRDGDMSDCPCGMDYTDYNCRRYREYAHTVRAYFIQVDLMLRKTMGDLFEDEYTAE